MSYNNTEDIGDYHEAAQKALRAIEAIPYPATNDVLENVNLWGVQKCLDEIRAQIKLLQLTLVDVDKAIKIQSSTAIEVYFVTSSGEAPSQVFFTMEEAKKGGHRYVDSFDKTGERVTAYKRLPDGTWTTEF